MQQQTENANAKPRATLLAVWRWPLHWQILLGLLVGVLLGLLTGAATKQQTLQQVAIDRAKVELGLEEDAEVTPAVREKAREIREASDAWLDRRSEAADDPQALEQLGPHPYPGFMAASRQAAPDMLERDWAYMLYDLVGDLFLNGLKLIIVPIVMSSLIVAVAGMGRRSGFARLGGKTLAYYMTTSLVSILVGLMLVNLIQPGVVDPDKPVLNIENTEQFRQEFAGEQTTLATKTEGRELSNFLDTIREMIPPNIVDAAAEGQLLGLIVVSLLIGYFTARLSGAPHDTFMNFWQAVYNITLAVTDLVLRFAPIGVAALIAATLASNYVNLTLDDRLYQFFIIIRDFFITVLLALGTHFFIVLPLILLLVARVKPWRHYQAMAPALLTAFSTASSSGTLPVTLDCVEKRAGVSNRVGSFVLPLGATVNMDGTALYECVAAMFIAQAYGIELSVTQQFLIVWIALLTSIGVAGVPAASLVAIVIILKAVGVPMEGLAIILVVDRFLDMCRTAVNVFSDSCGAVVIGRTEGETDILQASPA